jgi:predicted TIM-barrel fold metal-dependent hydrolase
VLDGHAATSLVRGIRQILNWHDEPTLRIASAPDLMEQAAWRRGFSLLRRYDLSFDLQIYWPQMGMAHALARAFPDTVLVLNHFGMPVDRSPEGVRRWAAAMTRLAQVPNVAVKLSGFGLGHPGWTPADTAPLLERTIAIFGPSRVMVGTNLPVERLFSDGPNLLRTIETVVAPLSEEERDAVLCGTAERIYRI